MTDGIIQKVLKDYKAMSKEDSNNTHLSSYDQAYYRMIHKLLNKIEQELIEEIKKQFPITKPFIHVHGNHIIQQKLIGDNQ